MYKNHKGNNVNFFCSKIFIYIYFYVILGIYSFYNLSQSIVPLYKVCENDVNVLVKVLDKLANHGGNGPSIGKYFLKNKIIER